MKAFTEAKREQFLIELRRGVRRGAAAELVDLPRIDVLDFIDGNEAFRRLVEDAELEATELVEEALWNAAVSGNVPAAKAWLEMKGKMPTVPAQGQKSEPQPRANPFAELDNVTPIQRRR
jgi:hypothetical protein